MTYSSKAAKFSQHHLRQVAPLGCPNWNFANSFGIRKLVYNHTHGPCDQLFASS